MAKPKTDKKTEAKASKVEKKPAKLADKSAQRTGSYSAADISVLEGLEPVRKRPGMYIGTTGPDGLHHLITEIFDNSRDEAMGGFANHIEVVLLPNNRVRVADNGRGIPVDMHKQTKVSALETIMTTLHAGGKFGGDGYKVSGGLHGVGASVVNALSIYMKAEVHRDGGRYMQEYSQGKKKAAVKKVSNSNLNGTIINFEPDIEIFKEIKFDWQKIVAHMRQQAYLVKGLRITVIDAHEYVGKVSEDLIFLEDGNIDAPAMSFYFEGGLASLVKFYNQSQKKVNDKVFYIEKEARELGVESVEIALQYVDDISSRIVPFANNIYNSEGGTHITGFKTALTRAINNYARKNNILKEKDENLTGEDVLEGLTAVISVKLREIQFEGQTKAKLGSVEARGAVEAVFGESFGMFLEENPDDARSIVQKSIIALRARKAAKAAKDSVLRKGALEGMTLPGKLADCQTKDASESELFIVEGESAGGTAKQGRDRRTQAILPLKGKILNVERARLDKMLASVEIKNLVVALGTAIGDTFDISKLRYHKVVIATDADVDGAHIRTLILTLFYRYFKPLLEGGFIYIAQPPLYKLERGKEAHYFYNDEAKDKFFKEQGINDAELIPEENAGVSEEAEEESEETLVTEDSGDAKGKASKVKPHSHAAPDVPTRKIKWNVQRYKGLGEMTAEQMWLTTMNPANRTLKQVTIDDGADADRVFDMLMGTDVPARKSFIQSNAKYAEIDL